MAPVGDELLAAAQHLDLATVFCRVAPPGQCALYRLAFSCPAQQEHAGRVTATSRGDRAEHPFCHRLAFARLFRIVDIQIQRAQAIGQNTRVQGMRNGVRGDAEGWIHSGVELPLVAERLLPGGIDAGVVGVEHWDGAIAGAPEPGAQFGDRVDVEVLMTSTPKSFARLARIAVRSARLRALP